MKALFVAMLAAAAFSGPTAAASWGYPQLELQGQGQKGRQGGAERFQPGRESKPDRGPDREERRDRLNEDERRALHRDLDKASRELYQRRSPQ